MMDIVLANRKVSVSLIQYVLMYVAKGMLCLVIMNHDSGS